MTFCILTTILFTSPAFPKWLISLYTDSQHNGLKKSLTPSCRSWIASMSRRGLSIHSLRHCFLTLLFVRSKRVKSLNPSLCLPTVLPSPTGDAISTFNVPITASVFPHARITALNDLDCDDSFNVCTFSIGSSCLRGDYTEDACCCHFLASVWHDLIWVDREWFYRRGTNCEFNTVSLWCQLKKLVHWNVWCRQSLEKVTVIVVPLSHCCANIVFWISCYVW